MVVYFTVNCMTDSPILNAWRSEVFYGRVVLQNISNKIKMCLAKYLEIVVNQHL